MSDRYMECIPCGQRIDSTKPHACSAFPRSVTRMKTHTDPAWAYDRIFELEAYVARLEEALRECARLSGADLSDGFPTWPALPEFAAQEVKQMREDYDEAGKGALRERTQWRIMWTHATGAEAGAVWRDEPPSEALLSEWCEDFQPLALRVERRVIVETEPEHDRSFDQYLVEVHLSGDK